MTNQPPFVRVDGWKYGFLTVAFIRLLKKYLHFDLRYAVECTDYIVAGKRVALQFADGASASAFLAAAAETGAICELSTETCQVMPGRYAIVDGQGICGLETGRWKRRSILKAEAAERERNGH